MTHATTTAGDMAAALRAAGAGAGTPVGVAWSPDGVGLAHGDALLACPGDGVDAVRRVLEDLRPRLVWWSARDATALVHAGVRVPSSWDVAATHCLLHGGSDRDPALVWAAARGLDPAHRPRTGQLDLLAGGPAPESADDPVDPAEPVRPDGHLRPGWAEHGPPTPEAAARWAAAALVVQAEHQRALGLLPDTRRSPGTPALALLTAWSESAAELLAVELGVRGLPLDRATAVRLVEERVGPRPLDAATAAAARARRDDAVRALVPGAEDVDLRNPASVRALLGRVGIDVPDTRAWRLEPFRGTHPLVAALIDWRQAERIATTYGFGWLDRDVGPDGRLRGSWTGCDVAAGRMTASAGLHNLPAPLRPAVAAAPGHVFVRADLGQIEPRVLAAVSGDPAFAAATRAADLYAPVGAALKVERPVAKVAVLAAMYGQTSGAAGEALKDLERPTPRPWPTSGARTTRAWRREPSTRSAAAGCRCGAPRTERRRARWAPSSPAAGGSPATR